MLARGLGLDEQLGVAVAVAAVEVAGALVVQVAVSVALDALVVAHAAAAVVAQAAHGVGLWRGRITAQNSYASGSRDHKTTITKQRKFTFP